MITRQVKHKMMLFVISIAFLLLNPHVTSTFINNLKINPVEWLPESIFNSTTYQNGIVDPENYLKDFEDKNLLYYQIDEIKRLKEIDVTLVIISKISSVYSNGVKKNISKFVDDLSSLLADKKSQSDWNSLIILFSVEDKQMQIRTGSEVAKNFDNYSSAKLLRSIKKDLKSENYGIASAKVLQNIYDKLVGAGTSVFTSFFLLFLFWIL